MAGLRRPAWGEESLPLDVAHYLADADGGLYYLVESLGGESLDNIWFQSDSGPATRIGSIESDRPVLRELRIASTQPFGVRSR